MRPSIYSVDTEASLNSMSVVRVDRREEQYIPRQHNIYMYTANKFKLKLSGSNLFRVKTGILRIIVVGGAGQYLLVVMTLNNGVIDQQIIYMYPQDFKVEPFTSYGILTLLTYRNDMLISMTMAKKAISSRHILFYADSDSIRDSTGVFEK